jgi:hypothetical protein
MITDVSHWCLAQVVFIAIICLFGVAGNMVENMGITPG